MTQQFRHRGAPALHPGSHRPTVADEDAEVAAEAALALRRQHPRWGAPLIRSLLRRDRPARAVPSARALQRRCRRHG